MRLAAGLLVAIGALTAVCGRVMGLSIVDDSPPPVTYDPTFLHWVIVICLILVITFVGAAISESRRKRTDPNLILVGSRRGFRIDIAGALLPLGKQNRGVAMINIAVLMVLSVPASIIIIAADFGHAGKVFGWIIFIGICDLLAGILLAKMWADLRRFVVGDRYGIMDARPGPFLGFAFGLLIGPIVTVAIGPKLDPGFEVFLFVIWGMWIFLIGGIAGWLIGIIPQGTLSPVSEDFAEEQFEQEKIRIFTA